MKRIEFFTLEEMENDKEQLFTHHVNYLRANGLDNDLFIGIITDQDSTTDTMIFHKEAIAPIKGKTWDSFFDQDGEITFTPTYKLITIIY